MLYVFTALRAEAEPFIREFGLKKRPEESSLQMYADSGESVLLTVTGTGPVRAAAAVGTVLGRLTGEERRDAAMLNFGSCAVLLGENKSSMDGDTNADCGGARETVCFAGGGEYHAAAEKGDRTAPAPLYRINCLWNADSGRVWYPDLLVRSSLPEAILLSGSRVHYQDGENPENAARGTAQSMPPKTGFMSGGRLIHAGEKDGDEASSLESCEKREVRMFSTHYADNIEAMYPVLYDMEGAAIYEAGNLFLGPHQMHFLKCVTDRGDAETVTRETLTRCAENAAEPLLAYAEDLLRSASRQKREGGAGEDAGASIADGICASSAMETKLAGLLHYAECAGIPWRDFFQKLKAAGRFPAPDRRRGKEILADFEQYVSGI